MKLSKWIVILLVVLLCGSLLIGADRDEKKEDRYRDKAQRYCLKIDLSALEDLEIHLEGLEEHIAGHVETALAGLEHHLDFDHLMDRIEPALHLELEGLKDIGIHAAHMAQSQCMKALMEVDRALSEIDWEDFIIDFDMDWDDWTWDHEDDR